MNQSFSIFENVEKTTPLQSITLEQFIRMVRGEMKPQTKALLLRIKDTKYKSQEYNSLKSKLPLVTLSGVFSSKKDSDIVKSSGLACFDLDTNNIDTANELKQQIAVDDFTYVIFDSVGVGFRIIVKFPEKLTSELYKEYYNGYVKYLSEKYSISTDKKSETHIDTSCSNISRGWFMSLDENLHVNDNSLCWMEKLIEKQVSVELSKEIPNTFNYKRVMKPLDMIRNCVQGEKHDTILKASRLMGGYVLAGFVSYEEAYRLLMQEASVFAPQHTADGRSRKAIIDGLENGMKSPLKDLPKEEFAKALDDMEKEADIFIKLGKIHYNVDDSMEEILQKHKSGISRGFDIGFYSLRENYTVKLGGTTYIYGLAASGKTYFHFQLLLNLSKMYGLKHVVMSEEMGNHSDIFIELLQMHVGQDFYNDYNNSMNEEQVKEGLRFIKSHFIVIDSADVSLTVTDFFDYVNTLERIHNVKFHTTTIDPYNSLKNDSNDAYAGSLTLSQNLGHIRKDAVRNNRHNFVITHGTKPTFIVEKQSKKRVPLPLAKEELEGGMMWSKKGLNMISIFLPRNLQGVPDYVCAEDEVRVFEEWEMYLDFQKIKPNFIGRTGKKRIYLDPKRHQYYEVIDGNIFYAMEFNEDVYKEMHNEVQTTYANFDFDTPPPF